MCLGLSGLGLRGFWLGELGFGESLLFHYLKEHESYSGLSSVQIQAAILGWPLKPFGQF